MEQAPDGTRRGCRIAGPVGKPGIVAVQAGQHAQPALFQGRVDLAYRDKSGWAKMAILNTARVGKFSSDRTIREYAEQIWKLSPVRV